MVKMHNRDFDIDAFVVGGGPAGLAAAIAARRQGFSVIVADSAVPPIDKACGEGLMPDALHSLHQLGVSLDSHGTGKFQGIKFIGAEGAVESHFQQGAGTGIRRTRLHQALLDSAAGLGVQFLWGTHIDGSQDSGIRTGDRTIRARWIIGADGDHSHVRDWAGLSSSQKKTQRIGMRQHFQIGPMSEFVEIYWGDHGQAYVTPIGANEICVALIAKKKSASFDEGIAQYPALANHLQGAVSTSSVRGAVTSSRKLKSVHSGNIALIGEASGSVDAITGEGLGMAFRQAVALSHALVANDLALYQTAHKKIASLPSFMAKSMLLMDKSPWIRKHAMRAFVRKPVLFEQLLSVHVGELGLEKFGMRGAFDLGWEMLSE
jgi:flavin-dependent dehydrogenase